MVSSTFTDLAAHRRAVIEALKHQGLVDVAMENDGARVDADVIDSSLAFVRDGAAYIGVISHKYGQTPFCPKRNPNSLSITELEFNEALRLDRPILLFIMGEEYRVTKRDVEKDPEKERKLDAFRERAKQMHEGSEIERVFEIFNSLDEFKLASLNAVAKLRQFLDEQSHLEDTPKVEPAEAPTGAGDAIASRPHFVAVPRYAGSHKFVGRTSQLETLSDWASAADPHPVFLFEAIGGSGKSILTWEWVTRIAPTVREDWAGRFWYSFYEKSAVMADFCRHAPAYMTTHPVDDFWKKKAPELAERLMAELNARPWLLVLDGLERVLVAYNRFDAAQLRDEEADTAGDQIADREPCAAIRSEDDELLRRLAIAEPSKLLVTSRLTPLALLNPSRMPRPGVRCDPLPGLRPPDAEEMIRACGVTGTSETIRAYLQENCDCHPLVIGALAGLINDYLLDRGNFDRWAAVPAFGGSLNLAELDLVARRNNILESAFDALSETSRKLLSTLALLYGAVDYETISAFNPHLLLEPEAVQDPEVGAAETKLVETVRDLERRGLLQYDAREKRYDLHPVVRGVAVGRLRSEEKETLGQRVVDHFSQQTHDPYEQAETLEDVAIGLQLVRGLLQMGRFEDAFDTLYGDLSVALLYNLTAVAELVSLLQPFFPGGWSARIEAWNEFDTSFAANLAGVSLRNLGRTDEAIDLFSQAIRIECRRKDWSNFLVEVANVADACRIRGRQAARKRLLVNIQDFAGLIGKRNLFTARFNFFAVFVDMGLIPEAEAEWRRLDPMGRNWPREIYRSGEAEYWFAKFRYEYGELREEDLTKAENLARAGHSRSLVRNLHNLRGRWHLKRGEITPAIESLREAVRMAREVGQDEPGSEAYLALAKLRAGEGANAREEAERLSGKPDRSALSVATLWDALGDRDKAEKHALRAHRWAIADGEPYVYRYELDQECALLRDLGVAPPETPVYDPSKDEPFPWEKDVVAALEELRAEKRDKEAEKN